MDRIQLETPDLNEQAWNTWIEKGKRRDRAQARTWMIIAGIVLPLLAVIAIVGAVLIRH